jgi:hypothetical protein
MNRPVLNLHRIAGATRDPEMMRIYCEHQRDLRPTRHVVVGPLNPFSLGASVLLWVTIIACMCAIAGGWL